MTSEDARRLRQIFWETVPPEVTTADQALAYSRESTAMVINVGPRGGVADELKSMGKTVFDTAWGSVFIDDTPEKRMGARLLVRALVSREKNSLRMLEDLLPDVDTRVERERPKESGRQEWREDRRRSQPDQTDEESQTE
jgi:hypothetical protein